ncbi:unnamed protein product, partial [Discosporangium mesarthrocarpum]
MGVFSPTSLQFWLPAGYIVVVVFAQRVRSWIRGIGVDGNGGKQKPLRGDDNLDSINTPLLQDGGSGNNGGSTFHDESGPPRFSITATDTLWGVLTLSWVECVYQGVRAVLEACNHGFNTNLFVTGTTMCVAWLLAITAVTHDHWTQAAIFPVLDDAGQPKRQRMWWALWPFFNLSFITAITAYFTEGQQKHDHLIDYLADDSLWSLLGQAILLLFVTYSALVGATVELSRREPNEEFTAGFLSAALFSWFSPFIDIGQKKQLDLADLPIQ